MFPSEVIMQLSLPLDIQRQIEERVRSGQYRSAEDVVTAAVSTLAQQEAYGEFEAGELDAILGVGEEALTRGQVISGAEVAAELSRRHQARRGNAE